MKKWKLFVVLISMMLGLIQTAKGQIYESEACFYAPAGSKSVTRIVKFEGSRVWVKACGFSRQKLAESKNYYENETWTDWKDCAAMYEYDYSMSTSQRVVYKREKKIANHQMGCSYCIQKSLQQFGSGSGGCGAHGYKVAEIWYVAFSIDKSSYIYWYVNANDVDKTPRGKTTFTRVPKEDLLPKAANYDFLNE